MTMFGDGLFQYGGAPVGFNGPIPFRQGKVLWVDGTNGAASNDGSSPDHAMNTIQGAVTLAGAGDVIYVYPKLITDFTGDPTSYAETIIIPATTPHLSIIGISHGRTQGGLPQIKKGSGATALLTIRAAGCYIANLGFNGNGSTGGGILLDEDSSTKTAFGTTIEGCHFKNCVGSNALSAITGGAIMWAATGNAWQVLIKGNRFYKNVADVVLKGTTSSVPQDVIIENNVFSGPADAVDCNLFLKGGGSGMNGVIIRNNVFPCYPALGSAVNHVPMNLTGCVGILCGNHFGFSGKTFGATGDSIVPTTVFMAGNWQETAVGNDNYQAGVACRT